MRVAKLINSLAATCGVEKSRAAVEGAVAELGISSEVLNPEQVREVLDLVAKHDGMLGITARFVRVRIESGRPLRSILPPPMSGSLPPPSSPHRLSLSDPVELMRPAMPTMFSRRMLVSLLTGTLGRETADSCVNEAADQLALPAGELTRDHVFALLDNLAEQPGKVGVTARFAKARLLLKEN